MSVSFPTYHDYAPLRDEPDDEWNDRDITDEEFSEYMSGSTFSMPEKERKLTKFEEEVLHKFVRRYCG